MTAASWAAALDISAGLGSPPGPNTRGRRTISSPEAGQRGFRRPAPARSATRFGAAAADLAGESRWLVIRQLDCFARSARTSDAKRAPLQSREHPRRAAAPERLPDPHAPVDEKHRDFWEDDLGCFSLQRLWTPFSAHGDTPAAETYSACAIGSRPAMARAKLDLAGSRSRRPGPPFYAERTWKGTSLRTSSRLAGPRDGTGCAGA